MPKSKPSVIGENSGNARGGRVSLDPQEFDAPESPPPAPGSGQPPGRLSRLAQARGRVAPGKKNPASEGSDWLDNLRTDGPAPSGNSNSPEQVDLPDVPPPLGEVQTPQTGQIEYSQADEFARPSDMAASLGAAPRSPEEPAVPPPVDESDPYANPALGELPDDTTLPDWLKNLKLKVDQTPNQSGPAASPAKASSEETPGITGNMPQWLRDFAAASTAFPDEKANARPEPAKPAPPVEEVSETSEAELPDWLRSAKLEGFIEPEVPQKDILDWLKGPSQMESDMPAGPTFGDVDVEERLNFAFDEPENSTMPPTLDKNRPDAAGKPPVRPQSGITNIQGFSPYAPDENLSPSAGWPEKAPENAAAPVEPASEFPPIPDFLAEPSFVEQLEAAPPPTASAGSSALPFWLNGLKPPALDASSEAYNLPAGQAATSPSNLVPWLQGLQPPALEASTALLSNLDQLLNNLPPVDNSGGRQFPAGDNSSGSRFPAGDPQVIRERGTRPFSVGAMFHQTDYLSERFIGEGAPQSYPEEEYYTPESTRGDATTALRTGSAGAVAEPDLNTAQTTPELASGKVGAAPEADFNLAETAPESAFDTTQPELESASAAGDSDMSAVPDDEALSNWLASLPALPDLPLEGEVIPADKPTRSYSGNESDTGTSIGTGYESYTAIDAGSRYEDNNVGYANAQDEVDNAIEADTLYQAAETADTSQDMGDSENAGAGQASDSETYTGAGQGSNDHPYPETGYEDTDASTEFQDYYDDTYTDVRYGVAAPAGATTEETAEAVEVANDSEDTAETAGATTEKTVEAVGASSEDASVAIEASSEGMPAAIEADSEDEETDSDRSGLNLPGLIKPASPVEPEESPTLASLDDGKPPTFELPDFLANLDNPASASEAPSEPEKPTWQRLYIPEKPVDLTGASSTPDQLSGSGSDEAEAATGDEIEINLPAFLQDAPVSSAEASDEESTAVEPAPEAPAGEGDSLNQESSTSEWANPWEDAAEEAPAQAAKPVEEATPAPAELPTAVSEDEDDIPPWLKALSAVAPPEAVTPRPSSGYTEMNAGYNPAEAAGESQAPLPDWLRDDLDHAAGPSATAETETAQKPVQPKGVPAETRQLPDWLQETSVAPAPAVIPDFPIPTDLPDWLKEPEAPALTFGADDYTGPNLPKDPNAGPPVNYSTLLEEVPNQFSGSNFFGDMEGPAWLRQANQPKPPEISPGASQATLAAAETTMPHWLRSVAPPPNAEPAQENVIAPPAGPAPEEQLPSVYLPPQLASAAVLEALLAPPAPTVIPEATGVEKRPLGLLQGNIVRYILYILLIAVALIGLLQPLPVGSLPVAANVQTFYDQVDRLPANSKVLVAFDWEADRYGEMGPLSTSVVQHIMAKRARLVTLSLNPQGPALAARITDELATNTIYGNSSFYKYGSTYLNLGWRSGQEAALRSLFGSIGDLTDYKNGKRASGLAATSGINSLADFDLIVVLAGDEGSVRAWVEQVGVQPGARLILGVPLAVEPIARPYAQGLSTANSNQLSGENQPRAQALLAGLNQTAQYDRLLQDKLKLKTDPTVSLEGRLSAQSLAALLLIVVIIVGNVLYLARRRR